MKKDIIIFLYCLLSFISCIEDTSKNTLTISFTGDVLLDRGVRDEIERRGGDPSFLLEDVTPLFRASDAVVINLECPITDSVTPINKRFIFRGKPNWLASLKEAGITHAVLANNHSMDQGRRGLISTNRHLEENEIVAVGYGENQTSACKPIFISKNNINVAIFSVVRLPLENWVALDNYPGVCQASIENTSEAIKTLKAIKPNCFAVVVLHWGIEYMQQPSLSQRADARMLIDAGADAIIGHHPHVIQPDERYKGKPIFYSLGNFIFDQTKPFTDKGLLVQLMFDKDSITSKKYNVQIKKSKPCLDY